jgi:hypothetical protein
LLISVGFGPWRSEDVHRVLSVPGDLDRAHWLRKKKSHHEADFARQCSIMM